jgi:hypothetical protein
MRLQFLKLAAERSFSPTGAKVLINHTSSQKGKICDRKYRNPPSGDAGSAGRCLWQA